MFESHSGEVYLIQHYVIKFVSDLRQVSGFHWFRSPINCRPRYNWNIVESGIKYYKPKPQNIDNWWQKISLYHLRTTHILALHNKIDHFKRIRAVSSNPAHGEVYSIQHYVFVSDLWQVGDFLQGLQFPPPIQLTVMI